MPTLRRLSVMAFLVCVHLCLSGFAQVTTATFYGVITDSSGAVIPGASVSLRNEQTGVTMTAKSDGVGEFGLTFLQRGRYTMRIEASGFKVLEEKGIELGAAQNVRRSFVLEVGAATETVSVVAQAPLVNAVSTEQRQAVTLREVRELPLARRNVEGVTALDTGAFLLPTYTLIYNGLGLGTSSFTIDGTEGSPYPAETRLSSGGLRLTALEAVEEVQTVKGVLPAEYSRAMSGNMNILTRSGTNDWHGSLFENWQGRVLNARNQFLSSKSPFVFNQFGGSVGGPIIHNRLFIFGVYEGDRESNFLPISGVVPSARLRAQAIAAVPAYKPYLDAFPLPNQPGDPNAATGIYAGASASSAKDNRLVLKPDFWISRLNKISSTWTRQRPSNFTPAINQLNPNVGNSALDRLNFAYTHVGNPWTAETRVSYQWQNSTSGSQWTNVKDPNNPSETMTGGRRLPTFALLGFGDNGKTGSGSVNIWSVDEKVARNIGKHSLKFGASVYKRNWGGSSFQSPIFFYQDEESFLKNDSYRAVFTYGTPPYQLHAWEAGAFIQDNWRLSPKLVVNLGLRYDWFNHAVARGSTQGCPCIYNPDGIRDSNFTIGPLRPVDKPFESDKLNFGPRIGLVYNPDADRTVIRLGFGTIFAPLNGTLYNGTFIMVSSTFPQRSIFLTQDLRQLGLRYPAYNEDVLKLVQSGTAVGGFDVLDPHVTAPYSFQWDLTLQRALTRTLILESGFIANRGVKFVMRRFYNEPNRITGERPNPTTGTAYYFDDSDSSHYLSWQTSLQQRFSKQFTGNAHYTWGKAISYGPGGIISDGAQVQGFFNIASNRGLASYAPVHRFTSDFIYETPQVANVSNRMLRHLLGIWQVSGIFVAQTGIPLLIDQSSAVTTRPDATGLPPVLGNYRDTLQYLNPAAFALVPISKVSGSAIRPGTLGRNPVFGPGLVNLDFAFGKNIAIRENVRLQFRFDMMNSLNHTNFTGINTSATSGSFGRILSTAGARIGQLSGRLSW